MNRADKVFHELGDLYDFFQKIKKFRVKEKMPGVKVKEIKADYKKRRLPRKKKY